MFDKNFNIILGGRYSGRSNFLFDLSTALTENGYKTFFFGGTSEFESDRVFTKSFTYCRFSKSLEIDNISSVELIKEISERDNYDYIIVDDVEQISKKCLLILKSSSVPKIITCSIIPLLGEVFNSYEIKVDYDKSLKINSSIIKIDNEHHDSKRIINSIIRDKKINQILTK